REFARLIRMNESSITNYSSKGTVPSHLAVIATLIGALAAHEIDFRELIAQTAIEAKRPRGRGMNFRKNGSCATEVGSWG
ncbi:XRE family transcriptional regulator, partial [Burkholderia lata]|uniref:XRE family transcriptional regulator n=1 Tax=Burkholderia lata (strain ATCC 17760 / DSM 23089 / LMG 22485 / NCIMB 9086 / R18194 / 383) TaxID=482957 RepID=UPI0015836C47